VRGFAFSHVLLSVAAALLIPQALECCHGESHTVIESLAANTSGGPERHQSMMHHHSAGRVLAVTDQHQRTDGTVREFIAEMVHARQIGDAVFIGLPAAENGGQSPSVAAVLSSWRLPAGNIGWFERAEGNSLAPGRSLRPAIPPPRA
jgi:hypothetical protein